MTQATSRKLSERAINCLPSPTLGIAAKANAMKADGIDVVSFSAGEPDFDTPQNVKDAAIEAINSGQTKYTPSAGTPALKNAIISKLQRDNGLTYKPAEIIASAGAKHSIYNVMQAMIDPGDEVIIPSPYWVSYPEQVKLAGGIPVIVPTDEQFLTTAAGLEKYVTSKTKILIINSPSNPTGAVYSPQALSEVAEIAVAKDIYVLSDEIYEKILFDGRQFVSMASFGEEIKKRTITINGLSKSYSMTGWRIGYTAADAEIVAAMGRIQDQSTSNPSSITQAAAVEALNGPQGSVTGMACEFEKRRGRIVELLNAIPGVKCPTPGGAFYVFPNVRALYGKTWQTASGAMKTIRGSDDFSEFLLETVAVAVIPGSGFGADEHIRLSYATSMASIEKGTARIAEAVGKLKD